MFSEAITVTQYDMQNAIFPRVNSGELTRINSAKLSLLLKENNYPILRKRCVLLSRFYDSYFQ